MLEKIIINHNAYFYRKQSNLSASKVGQIFTDISRSKLRNRYTLRQIKQITNVGSKTLYYSICIFPYSQRPSFLKEDEGEVLETKFSFLLIVEYADYIIIFKKNVSNLKAINEHIELLDYEVVSRVFLNSETSFEKFNVSSMNTADTAVRNRSIEAVDLKGQISGITASKQVINSMRLDNSGLKHTLALGTSRINKIGDKKSLQAFFEFCTVTCDKISAFNWRSTYLDIFAKPLKFAEHRGQLTPTSILLKFDFLKEQIENGVIHHVYQEDENGEAQEVEPFSFLSEFDTLCDIEEASEEDRTLFPVNNLFDSEMKVRMASKSIRIASPQLSRIKMDRGEAGTTTLLNFLNSRGDFIVNFSEADLIYTHRKLFKDHRLLDDINGFMSVFVSHEELSNTTSEKGIFTENQTEFSNQSVFRFITHTLAADATCLICDDLGNEWADFIGVFPESIEFYHAKHGNEGLSATKFSEVVSQTQKNFGNVEASDSMINQKRDSWDDVFRLNHVTTQISRLIKGQNNNLDESLDYYKTILKLPNLKKRIHLVVDFISKSRLESSLIRVKNGEQFDRRKEVLQILWFVSSLIAIAKDLSMEIYIECQE